MRKRTFASTLVVCIAVLLASGPAAVSGQCQPGTTPVFEVEGSAIEGVAVTKDGSVYGGGSITGKLFKRSPDGITYELASLWDHSPGEEVQGYVLGLTADNKRNVFAAVLHFFDPEINGVWRIDRNDVVELYAQLPLGVFPNGITIDDRKNLYVGDDGGGRIFRVPPEGEAELWIEHPLLLDSWGFGFGVNGLDHFKRAIYGAITLDGRIVRVPINPDGSAGTPENYVTSDLLFGVDHAIFDLFGNLYAANVFFHTIVRVDTNLLATNLIEGSNEIYKPATLSWGAPDHVFTLYVTNYEDAFDWLPPPDPEPNPADVTRIDLCPPGRR